MQNQMNDIAYQQQIDQVKQPIDQNYQYPALSDSQQQILFSNNQGMQNPAANIQYQEPAYMAVPPQNYNANFNQQNFQYQQYPSVYGQAPAYQPAVNDQIVRSISDCGSIGSSPPSLKIERLQKILLHCDNFCCYIHYHQFDRLFVILNQKEENENLLRQTFQNNFIYQNYNIFFMGQACTIANQGDINSEKNLKHNLRNSNAHKMIVDLNYPQSRPETIGDLMDVEDENHVLDYFYTRFKPTMSLSIHKLEEVRTNKPQQIHRKQHFHQAIKEYKQELLNQYKQDMILQNLQNTNSTTSAQKLIPSDRQQRLEQYQQKREKKQKQKQNKNSTFKDIPCVNSLKETVKFYASSFHSPKQKFAMMPDFVDVRRSYSGEGQFVGHIPTVQKLNSNRMEISLHSSRHNKRGILKKPNRTNSFQQSESCQSSGRRVKFPDNQ